MPQSAIFTALLVLPVIVVPHTIMPCNNTNSTCNNIATTQNNTYNYFRLWDAPSWDPTASIFLTTATPSTTYVIVWDHKSTVTNKYPFMPPHIIHISYYSFVVCTSTVIICTSPNTVCLPSNQGHGTVVMKNWEPLVLGPALALHNHRTKGIHITRPAEVHSFNKYNEASYKQSFSHCTRTWKEEKA